MVMQIKLIVVVVVHFLGTIDLCAEMNLGVGGIDI